MRPGRTSSVKRSSGEGEALTGCPPTNPVVRLSHRGNFPPDSGFHQVGAALALPTATGGRGGAGPERKESRSGMGGTCGRVTAGLCSPHDGGSVLGLQVGRRGWGGRSPAVGGRAWPLRWPHEWMDDAVLSSQGADLTCTL